MPVAFKIWPDLQLLKVDYSGTVTVGEIAKSYAEFMSTPGHQRVKYGLNDLRGIAELRAFYDGMAVLADMVASDGEEQADPWDIAIVSDNLGHYPLLLEYAARIRESSALRCEVLKDIPSAIRWLGLDFQKYESLLTSPVSEPSDG